jgi:hypothetical protein
MLKFTFTVSGLDAVQARLKKAGSTIAKEVAPVVEFAAVAEVQDHLDAHYVGQPNKLGGTPTGYWTGVRNSVTPGRQGDAVTVEMKGAGLLMKWLGGTIKASGRISSVTGKPIKNLSIPVHASAHGKVPAMFGNALYGHGFAGGAGRHEGDTARGFGLWLRTGSKPSDSDPLLFWLKPSVNIPADKNILPPPEKLAASCGEAVKILLESTS